MRAILSLEKCHSASAILKEVIDDTAQGGVCSLQDLCREDQSSWWSGSLVPLNPLYLSLLRR